MSSNFAHDISCVHDISHYFSPSNKNLPLLRILHNQLFINYIRLTKINCEHPDVLVMTATPIPRTLSLTLYGELDVSIIDELPPGRKPVLTRSRRYEQVERVYSFLKEEVVAGPMNGIAQR